MGLERRQRGGLYYYRKVREGNRVRSVYVASGECALRLAELDAMALARQKLKQTAQADMPRDGLDLEATLRMCTDVDAIVKQELEKAGYHKPKRWRWRKRRL